MKSFHGQQAVPVLLSGPEPFNQTGPSLPRFGEESEHSLTRWMNTRTGKFFLRGKSVPLSPGERDRVRGKETLNPPHRQPDASASPMVINRGFLVD